jgi:hypothetical protein
LPLRQALGEPELRRKVWADVGGAMAVWWWSLVPEVRNHRIRNGPKRAVPDSAQARGWGD